MKTNQQSNEKVSQFQNLYSPKSRSIPLEEFFRMIVHDNDVRHLYEAYCKMKEALGKAKADEEVKQKKMPAVSVGVRFDGMGRQADRIVEFTGLAMVDLDHVDNVEQAMALVCNDPHTLMAYRTVSGAGVRIIYRFQRERAGARIDATTWRAAFLAGNEHYEQLTGCAYDRQCTDYQRLCGLSHDPQAYYNPQAEPFVLTDEAIVETNLTAAGEKGKPRRRHDQGTCSATVAEAWPKVEQALQRHGLLYQPGHHHDYVMHAAFLMNRYGVPLEELCAWAQVQWSDYSPRQREATIRSCYRQTDEHGTWKLRKQAFRQQNAGPLTLPEIGHWLGERVEIVYNLVTDMTLWRPLGQAEWQQLDDRTVCTLRTEMTEQTGRYVAKNDLRDVILSKFSTLKNPVADYLKALPQWDGHDRVAELCSHVAVVPAQTGQSPQEAHRLMQWALHKWLVAMVATWVKDHGANHQIFVLIGPQGIYKTTFFRYLLPPVLMPYFWENAHNSFSSKDDHLAVAENCLIEIEEIDLQSPSEISELKALVTSFCVKERRPYARFREEKPRLASFCGSGNQQHFLCDETGNRRWLCFLVSHIDDPRTWNLDYDQLYAQLYHELNDNFHYWFNTREQARMERQNQAFRVESAEEQLIRTYLRVPRVGEKITLMNAAGICKHVNGGTMSHLLSPRKVSNIAKRMGFKQTHTMQGNFYEVFVIPINQIQASISVVDDKGKTESTHSQSVEKDLPF